MIQIESRENILICLSGAPSNARVIRVGADLANAYGCRLSALFVEPEDFQHESSESRTRLYENIRLAESLGAQVTTLFGEDAAIQIAEYARISGVTKIVLGKSPGKQGIFAKDNTMKSLEELAPEIDIYIIPDKSSSSVRMNAFSRIYGNNFRPVDILKTLLILAICTLTGIVFVKFSFSPANVILAYTIGVLAIAMLTSGRICSLISSILAVLIFNFFFVEPFFSLRADPSQIATFAVMLIAAILISSLTTRIKSLAIRAAGSAYRTEILLESTQKFQKAENAEVLMKYTAEQLGKLLERSIIIYMIRDGKLENRVDCEVNGKIPDEGYASASRLLKKGAGAPDSDFSGASGVLSFPVRGTGEVLLAAVCINGKNNVPLTKFEKSLMTALLDECGIIMENMNNIRAKREAEEQIRFEELRSNLLNSISHDLRTPLTGISGNAALLMSGTLEDGQKHDIYSQIYNESAWLINLVENLLSMTRISGGKTIVKTQPELICDVFDEALQHIDPDSTKHTICRDIPDEFIMASMDAQLIVQVMINLINNAIKYTQEGSTITLSAYSEAGRAVIKVSDDGPGIDRETASKIFDLFYTNSSRGDMRRGIGLGLALCRSIVAAHGGNLEYTENVPHGSIFSFSLPIVEVTIDEQSQNTRS